MTAHSSMLHIRMEDDLKARASEALAAMGLSGLRCRAPAVPPHRRRAGVSARIKVPNAETREALAEADALWPRARRALPAARR